MPNKPSDTHIIQGQFLDLASLLHKAIASISEFNDPGASNVLQDLKSVANSLVQLQGGVSGRIQTGKEKLQTLVETGHVINSSLGHKQVLEEVMDSLIALVQAERGFLVLREADGELKVQIARGIDHVDLDEDAFALSRTIVQSGGIIRRTGVDYQCPGRPAFWNGSQCCLPSASFDPVCSDEAER